MATCLGSCAAAVMRCTPSEIVSMKNFALLSSESEPLLVGWAYCSSTCTVGPPCCSLHKIPASPP